MRSTFNSDGDFDSGAESAASIETNDGMDNLIDHNPVKEKECVRNWVRVEVGSCLFMVGGKVCPKSGEICRNSKFLSHFSFFESVNISKVDIFWSFSKGTLKVSRPLKRTGKNVPVTFYDISKNSAERCL